MAEKIRESDGKSALIYRGEKWYILIAYIERGM